MLWLWLVSGLLILLFAWGLTCFLNRKYKRLMLPHRLLRTLRNALRSTGSGEDVQVLRSSALILTEHLLLLQRELSSAPSLPVDEDGIPHLLDLTHDLVDNGEFTRDVLLQALQHADPAPTPCEAYTLPLAVAAAQCQRLNRVLKAMLEDESQRNQAKRIVRRLRRARDVSAMLDKTTLTTVGLAELASLIYAQRTESLSASFNTWLENHALSNADLQEHAKLHQQHIAQELHRAISCLDSLQHLRWIDVCHEGDPLHPLLMTDPAGIYPRMDAASQLALRRRAEALARHTHLDTDTVVQHALHLAMSAERNAPEASVCFWFQEADGLQQLHHSLPGEKARIYARFALREDRLRYTCLWLFGVCGGFLFLQAGGPVYMLPFFALVTGVLGRWLLRHFPQRALPRTMQSNTPLRTLAVMPAMLSDPHEAIRMVRQLETVLHTFPDHVDLLLMGDFAPAITPASAGDQAILHAAASALDALDNPRLIYLHRGRSWDSAEHRYARRGGSLGAIRAVCRLVASGECDDALVLSTVDTARYERRYDYIMALSPDTQPFPGMYKQLLSAMIHPHSSRLPTGKGWRGYSILVPEGQHGFTGTGLLRPDAFLEATDNVLPAHDGAAVLAGELAGWAAVSGAHLRMPTTDNEVETQYREAMHGWQLLPWQLPLVQTPAGLVSNPLRSMSRFRLREPLRRTLVPLGQCTLLLYGLLTESPLLIVLALLPLLISSLPRTWSDALCLLCRLSLLPTSAAAPFRALHDVLRRRKSFAHSAAFEMWVQGIAAALLTGLGIALPGTSLLLLTFGVIFACFPLAHRVLDASPSAQALVSSADMAALHESAARLWSDVDQSLSALTAEDAPSPRNLAVGMISCACARELGLISANEAAMRIASLAEKLHTMSMVEDMPHCSAQECGYLLCALMTAAQALHIWLPELTPAYFNLSALLDELASTLDITRLYDPNAGLFCNAMNDCDPESRHIANFMDEALLLSVAACARGNIPSEHFEYLRRTRIRIGKYTLPLSDHTSAEEHLLPTLFLPLPEEDTAAFAHTLALDSCPIWAAVLCLPYVSTLADHVHSAELPDDIWHQGITLASMAHHLADAPLRRIFCSVPQVAAVLPLLEPQQPPLILPRI